MSLPPFNPRRTDPPKPEPGEGDDVPCVKCGAVALDTGLECSECGHDNYEAITGRPFGVPASEPKLCTYCGVVIDSGAACTNDGEFNHCPNKQIGEAAGGVGGNGNHTNCHEPLMKDDPT